MKYTHNGVSQGSMLGPLIYLYVNVLLTSSNMFNVSCTPTTLYCCLEDITNNHKAHTFEY